MLRSCLQAVLYGTSPGRPVSPQIVGTARAPAPRQAPPEARAARKPSLENAPSTSPARRSSVGPTPTTRTHVPRIAQTPQHEKIKARRRAATHSGAKRQTAHGHAIGVRLSVGYGFEVLQPGAAPVAHGFELGISLIPSHNWAIYLSYRPEFPTQASTTAVDLTLSRHVVEAGMEHEFWHKRRFGIGIRIGADLIVVKRSVQATEGDVQGVEGSPDVLSALSGYLAVSLAAVPHLSIQASLGMRVYVLSVQYVTHEGDRVLKPWQAEPSVRVGFIWSLW